MFQYCSHEFIHINELIDMNEINESELSVWYTTSFLIISRTGKFYKKKIIIF